MKTIPRGDPEPGPTQTVIRNDLPIMQASLAQEHERAEDHPGIIPDILQQLRNAAQEKRYTWLPDTVIRQVAGYPGEDRILKAVLSDLVNDFTPENAPVAIPSSIAPLYDRELARIQSIIDAGDETSLRFSLDVRQKDIAILTFRFIPVGAEFAEPWSCIWKRQVLTARASQFFRAANFFILKKNGFRPYFQLHMHQESHSDFHEEGWMKTYERLAELLELNPGHRGWFSSSWFVDPALETISPHLSYLRTVPKNNGGDIFYLEDDPQGRTGALATSKTRRREFESGHYRPRIYMRVWPSPSAIAWRKKLANEG